MARPDQQLKALQEKFVRLRITDMTEVDVGRFEYDFHTTFAAFILNHDGQIYLRYGARDDHSPESFVNVPSLVRALEAGLDLHTRWRAGDLRLPPLPESRPAQSYPLIREIVAKKNCVHCHQIAAAKAVELMGQPGFDRRTDVWVFPDPATLGMVLDPKFGNRLASSEGIAAQAGLRAGDEIIAAGGRGVRTYADLQFALHKLPEGTTTLKVLDAQRNTRELRLPEHWRVTDIGRRPMSHRMEPFPGFWSKALEDDAKERLGLPAKGFASQITKFWRPTQGSRAGLKEGDIVVAVGGVRESPLARNVMVYIRLHHETGEQIEVTYLRGGTEGTARFKLKAKPW